MDIGADYNELSELRKRSKAIGEEWPAWKTHSYNLVNKSDELEEELGKLVKCDSVLEDTIRIMNSSAAKKHEEMSEISRSMDDLVQLEWEEMENFEANVKKVASVITVYSPAQLTKDIKEVENETKKVQAEFETLSKETEDIRVKHGLGEIATATPSEINLGVFGLGDMLLDHKLKITGISSREMSREIIEQQLEKTVEKILNLSKHVKGRKI